ncbi:MAG: hypothetical protein K1X53_07520 [Candidatus Sumerlaeaceae bacterium]|nr:hypothetical protein [Candidatus Sumerlaeaceae bacterium]
MVDRKTGQSGHRPDDGPLPDLENPIDFDDPEAVEAELRRRELEEIARNFNPQRPLYPERHKVSQSVKKPLNRKGPANDGQDHSSRQSYQSDPRYKQFYDQVKKRPAANDYDAEVQPMSLDELEKAGWDGTPRPWDSTQGSAQPQPAPAPAPPRARTATIRNHPAQVQPPDVADAYEPGTIFSFDDGSVAIYKDAVSGKDYALFYFLEPHGVLAARGIFLEQYERTKIGKIPVPLLENMRANQRWDYDAIVFHLDSYELAQHVRRLGSPHAVTHTAHTRRAAPATASPTIAPQQPAPIAPEVETQPEVSPEPPAAAPREMLERGRVLKINVGGRIWESVYWTKDEIGPIVAHDTNKEWALMHLDLTRFKDALEYGDLLEPHDLGEIERSLARKV